MKENFFEVIHKDHDEIKGILGQLELLKNFETKQREVLLKNLEQEFKPHMKAEEDAFYTPLKGNKKLKAQILESIEEHHVIDFLLDGLDNTQKGDEQWGAKVKVLKEFVEHHVHEEEDELFPQANEVLTDDQMSNILQHFQNEKKKYKNLIA